MVVDASLPLQTSPKGEYNLANAERFGWSSVSGDLNSERIGFLKKYIFGNRILDAGCGGGGYVDYLSAQGKEVVGVDKHEEFLGVAIQKGLRGTYTQADLTQRIPFPDKSFDTSYCFDVLEHVDDVAALHELARVTRSRLILAVPYEDLRANKYLMTYSPYLDLTHLRYYTPDSLSALANTVRPARIEVFPECRIPIESLLRWEFRVSSRWPMLTSFYQSLFEFLVRRAKGPDWYIGLVAIVDLKDDAGSGA